MSPALTIRLTDELLAWLREISRRTGLPVGRIIRHQLARAKAEKGNQRFLSLEGKINGPSDLSSRKGFSTRWSPSRHRPHREVRLIQWSL